MDSLKVPMDTYKKFNFHAGLNKFWLCLSKYRRYFLFQTIQVEYFFVASLMMLSKEETVGTHATDGIESLRSRWTGPENSKTDVQPSKIQMCN